MAGLNRRSLTEALRKSLRDSNGSCVFISHASYYDDVANEIGRYIREVLKLDIYLALDDSALRAAVDNRDHLRVVEHIESGIRNSTHLLGLVGKKTRESWWVPFELGAARQCGKPVGYLALEEVGYLPSFLQIADVIEDDLGLLNWVQRSFQRYLTEDLKKSVQSLPVPSIPGIPRHRSDPVTYR